MKSDFLKDYLLVLFLLTALKELIANLYCQRLHFKENGPFPKSKTSTLSSFVFRLLFTLGTKQSNCETTVINTTHQPFKRFYSHFS